MSKWRMLKALLGKELQHNRGYLLVTVILLCYVPVLKSLYALAQGVDAAHKWGMQLSFMLSFHQLLMKTPPVSDNTMYILAVMVSLLLGAILLGEERKDSLHYLLTTPANRSAIILSKFLFGSMTLLLAMAINTIFLLSLSGALGLETGSTAILRWGLMMDLGMTAMFTLALLASTLTASVLPAASLGFLLIYLPRTVVVMAEQIAARYFQAPEAFSIKAQYTASYLTITNYLTGAHWQNIVSVSHDPNWRMYGVGMCSGPTPQLSLETLPLLLGILVLLGITIMVFQRTSLDEQGALFASPGIRCFFMGLCGLLSAYIFFFPASSTRSLFLLCAIGMSLVFYGLAKYLPQQIHRKDG
ncbi:MAG: ABC transporter permease [Methanobacterium sp.]